MMGMDFVFYELAGGLADELFLVVKLRIEVNKVDAAVSGHAYSSLALRGGWFVCGRGCGMRPFRRGLLRGYCNNAL
jgi:hypothetical protein